MNDETRKLWARLAEEGGAPVEHFDSGTVVDLPEPARRFLTAAIPEGAPLGTAVELEMSGRIKLGIWLPFTARQILRGGVGSVWAATVGGRVIRFVGADSFGLSGGRMQFRFHDRIPVVNAGGPDVDRSAAGRLAGETAAWLPQALTPQAGASWKPIDDHSATVILPGPDGPVDVDLTIDSDGQLTEIDLERWNGSAKPPAYQPFGATIASSLAVDGIHIAGAGTVGWARNTPDQDDAVFFHFQINAARFLESKAE
ncbi:MAG: hypothetical protein OES24_07605 [Acidimicrobiia bacterium]|nr:hypothetical protein [Acidimicrobiia bacterium]